MLYTFHRRVLMLCAACLLPLWAATPALAEAGQQQGRLVDVAWLQQHLAETIVLDASMTALHGAGHIPGAVSADLYRYGSQLPSQAVMERRIQSWGVSPGRKIVIYDQGGDMMAPRLFYDLYYHGLPASDLFILDGGLSKWKAQGGTVTQEPTPTPAPGTFRVTELREEVRVRLPEFLNASGDRRHHALVEALDPSYHYGEQKFFDRAGHVPNAIPMPADDFYNADKTFKSADELRRQLAYLGITPDRIVHSHCGGGVAASVPWFALQFVVERPNVKLYLESQREWLSDERGLPYWTYSAPQIQHDRTWLAGWNAPMLRSFGVAQLNIVDVRAPEQYALGHVAYAVNIPADTFRNHLARPEKLAELLGPAGVNPAHEVIIMAESGLTPGAALAFLAFEQLGQTKVSVLMDSVDEWGLSGHGLTKEPTVVGKPGTPKGIAVPATAYVAQLRPGLLIGDPKAARAPYPQVFIASGKVPSSRTPDGTVVQLPYTQLLNADGTPKPAKDLWKLISKAGVPRYAEVILFADDPTEAAVNYYLFRLMGWPDIKVWVN